MTTTTNTHASTPSLDVESYHVEELIFRSHIEYDYDRESYGAVDVDMDVHRAEANAHDFRVLMRIDLAPDGYSRDENPPYTISLRLVGYFTFAESTEEDDMQRMVRLNGSSILYGIARGIVGQATGASLHGQFVLPTVNFIELWKRKVAEARAKLDAHKALSGEMAQPAEQER